MIDLNQIIELAKEIEEVDPIKWSDLPLHRDSVYSMLATSILEKVQAQDISQREIILMASCIKLTVENFVLQIRLNDFVDK